MYEILRYTDEVDRSFGAAGMAIALFACDGEDIIASVSVEDGEPTLSFCPGAFFVNNPRFSARITWEKLLQELHIFSGMLIGNVLCRHVISQTDMRREIYDMIYDLISEHGQSTCSLDEDEIANLFDKDYRYFNRLFSHPAVRNVAQTFASSLRQQRRMTAGEVIEYMSRLSSF